MAVLKGIASPPEVQNLKLMESITARCPGLTINRLAMDLSGIAGSDLEARHQALKLINDLVFDAYCMGLNNNEQVCVRVQRVSDIPVIGRARDRFVVRRDASIADLMEAAVERFKLDPNASWTLCWKGTACKLIHIVNAFVKNGDPHFELKAG